MDILIAILIGLTVQACSVRIAFYNGGGAFSGDNKTTHVHEHEFYSAIAAATTLLHDYNNTLVNITEANVTSISVSNFDAVVFPGGSGSGQAAALGDAGIEAVRSFVRSGGAYIG